MNILKSNIQLNQTLFLSTILLTWVQFFKLDISYLEIFTTFWVVILLDLFFKKFNTWKFSFPYSWVNAWFGISFFLRTEELILYIFAALLAIVWKNTIKIKGRHFMNPSNMAVFLVLVLFPNYSWTNPLQWGQSVSIESYFFIFILVLVLWFLILSRLKQILNFSFYDLVLSFFITHLLLFLFITQESSINSFYLFFNVSFFIFIFFMLTDPRTNLETRPFRILYWSLVAISFYILQFYINENYSLLWSLFFMTLSLPLFRYLEKYNNNKSIFISLIFSSIMLLLLCVSIYNNWKADLLFDNRCNMLICK